jgi:hypothetical protein
MPHLTPIQIARAIAKLEENWSLAAVARELHCSKTCIFNIKRRWQENRLERPIRIGVEKDFLITEMGVSDEAKNVIPLKFLRKIKNKNKNQK